MSTIFGIDPGTKQSGWVLLSGSTVVDSGVAENNDLLEWIKHGQGADLLAIEMFEARGQAVGQESLETVEWTGQFRRRWLDSHPELGPESAVLIYRRKVKLHLCGNANVGDPNVRQALIDLFGPKGTKKAPGGTYGVSSHAWAALAVAVTAAAQANKVNNPPVNATGDSVYCLPHEA